MNDGYYRGILHKGQVVTTQEGRKTGLVKVTFECLLAALKLPPETKVLAVGSDLYKDEVFLKLEHPAFKPVKEGQPIPEYTPMLRQHHHTTTTTHFERWA